MLIRRIKVTRKDRTNVCPIFINYGNFSNSFVFLADCVNGEYFNRLGDLSRIVESNFVRDVTLGYLKDSDTRSPFTFPPGPMTVFCLNFRPKCALRISPRWTHIERTVLRICAINSHPDRYNLNYAICPSVPNVSQYVDHLLKRWRALWKFNTPLINNIECGKLWLATQILGSPAGKVARGRMSPRASPCTFYIRWGQLLIVQYTPNNCVSRVLRSCNRSSPTWQMRSRPSKAI